MVRISNRYDACPPGYKKCGSGCIPEGSNCPTGGGGVGAVAAGAVGGAGALYAAPKVANQIQRYRKLRELQAKRKTRKRQPAVPTPSRPAPSAPAPRQNLPALPPAGGTSGQPAPQRRSLQSIATERRNNRRTALSNRVGAETRQTNAGRQQRGLAALPAAGRTTATRNTLGGRLQSAGQTVRSATFGSAQRVRNRVGALRQRMGSGLRQTGRNLKAAQIRTGRSISRNLATLKPTPAERRLVRMKVGSVKRSVSNPIGRIASVAAGTPAQQRLGRMRRSSMQRSVGRTVSSAQRGLAARGRLARMQVGSARRSLGAGIQSARVGRRRTMQNVMRTLGGATHR